MSALGVPNSTSRPDPSTSTLSESRIVLSRCAIVSTVTEANSARTVRWRRDSDGQWNAKAIRVNRSQSEAIGGHQRPSGHQWPSVAISGHQWPSVAISGHQWPSVVALTWMRASVSESTEEVASSMITIAGRVSSARAMHNSWRCPADKFAPSSSTCSSSV